MGEGQCSRKRDNSALTLPMLEPCMPVSKTRVVEHDMSQLNTIKLSVEGMTYASCVGRV